MTTILPTHQCFDDCVDIVTQALDQQGKDWALDHLRVVHGICLGPEGPDKDEPFAHGWVEIDRSMVIQAGLINGERDFYVCKRTDMYKLLRVQLTTVYTLEEVWMKNRESNHVGPWEQVYRDLCTGERKLYQEKVK